MVGRDRVVEDLNAETQGRFPQPGHVVTAVTLELEHKRPVVAPVCDVNATVSDVEESSALRCLHTIPLDQTPVDCLLLLESQHVSR